ncbi:MAG: NADH-quinone oxidoreductase subunit NuoG [Thermodesulfovibrionales bacterium]
MEKGPAVKKEKATIFVEGRPYEVDAGQNLLDACLALGFDIPYFCWHPALGSVGACRLCAVKQFRDENDRKGRIVMSCMTPAEDGARISIEDPEARRFRASVIEWLMLNHPHDCPVCDEGGECHLQDMAVMTGHVYRRSRMRKRTCRNQDLGPFVNHEMNRCIQCFRCVRFYRDHAGGRDLDVMGGHDRLYFGRYEDGKLQSPLSGNLVEICPTGVFTDKTLKRHYARKWDLQTAPSLCVHCGLGCNTIPGERYGRLRRVLNRYNPEINGYFICDRGRFSYGFVNVGDRPRSCLIKSGAAGALEPAAAEEALGRLAGVLYFGANVIGIGSPRASLEANFLLRDMVGEDRFFSGMADHEHGLVSLIIEILRGGPAPSASLSEAALADAVLVLGTDPTNEAPMLELALRQAVRQKPLGLADRLRIPRWHDAAVRDAIQSEKGPLYVSTAFDTEIDALATRAHRAAPRGTARLGHAVACEIDPLAPAPHGMAEEERALAREIARALTEAERPLVVSGTGSGERSVIEAAANVAWALRRRRGKGSLFFVVPECNSVGAAMLSGRGVSGAFEAVRGGRADAIVILENDLFQRAEGRKVTEFLDSCRHVVVIDHAMTRTAARAGFVLPASAYAEADGTMVNNEGRAQRFFQVYARDDGPMESWRWLREMMASSRRESARGWRSLDEVLEHMASERPEFEAAREAAPSGGFRVMGLFKVPRQSHRASGRAAMHAHISVHEPTPPQDPDSPLAFSMEGFGGIPPAGLVPRYWRPGWNSVQALDKYQAEPGGPLRNDGSGRRLLGPGGGAMPYFSGVPEAFVPRKGEWLMVRLHHIFGSDELGMYSPDIQGLAPGPYVALCPEDAGEMGVAHGGEVDVDLEGRTLRLALRVREGLPRGVAGLPLVPGLSGIGPLGWVRIRAGRERK